MVAFTQLSAPVDLTPVDDSTFKDIDVSAYVTNASGVLLRLSKGPTYSADDVVVRKKGSTDTHVIQIGLELQTYVAVGIDVDDIFQIKLEASTGIWLVELIGYFSATDFVFFDNALIATPPDATWTDWDISASTGADTALAAVLLLQNNSASDRNVGTRMKGSTDNRVNDVLSAKCAGSPIVGCDGNEIFQVYREASFVGNMYCLGYAKSGVTMNVNAIEVVLSTLDTWEDMAPDLAAGAFIEAVSFGSYGTNNTFGARPNGITAFNHYEPLPGGHGWMVSGAAGGVIEGQKSHSSTTYYILGTIDEDVGGGGRIMSSLAGSGGLAYHGGIAGKGGGLAG